MRDSPSFLSVDIITIWKGASAIGTLIGGAEVGPSGGFAYSATDGLLTFQSGSTKFVVLMYTSGSS